MRIFFHEFFTKAREEHWYFPPHALKTRDKGWVEISFRVNFWFPLFYSKANILEVSKQYCIKINERNLTCLFLLAIFPSMVFTFFVSCSNSSFCLWASAFKAWIASLFSSMLSRRSCTWRTVRFFFSLWYNPIGNRLFLLTKGGSSLESSLQQNTLDLTF